MIDAALNIVVIECLALFHLPQLLPPAAAQDQSARARTSTAASARKSPFVAHAFDQAASLGERDDEDRAGQHDCGCRAEDAPVRDCCVLCVSGVVGVRW